MQVPALFVLRAGAPGSRSQPPGWERNVLQALPAQSDVGVVPLAVGGGFSSRTRIAFTYTAAASSQVAQADSIASAPTAPSPLPYDSRAAGDACGHLPSKPRVC